MANRKIDKFVARFQDNAHSKSSFIMPVEFKRSKPRPKGIKTFAYLAKTQFGLEEILADELRALGAEEVTVQKRAVAFRGNHKLLYKSNMALSTATSILSPIRTFTAKNEKKLYFNIKNIPWENIMDLDQTFSLSTTINSTVYTHTKFPALKAKDAIVDRFRDLYDERPSVSRDRPDIRINLHINETHCTISLDSSGDPLFKRGYRDASHQAPLNECLAAGIVRLTGWKRDCDLIDPMCGSGTLLIEAANYAYGIAPNVSRERFAFMNWKNYDPGLYQEARSELMADERNFKFRIYGSDIDRRSFRGASKAIAAAGFGDKIKLKVADFMELDAYGDKGMILMNPPYGERLEPEDINGLYGQIGDQFKKAFAGHQAWMLSSNMDALKHVGLKTSRRIDLMNGRLQCKLVNYELYQGSRREEAS